MNLPPINPSVSLPAESVKPDKLAASVRGWQVGQILNATVTARPDGQTATLRFGAGDVDLQTRIPLAPGDSVKVRVARTGERITLRLVDADTAVDPARGEAFRRALPRQQSLTGLLANLSRLVTSRPTTPARSGAAPGHTTLDRLPPQIRELAGQLLRQLPEARQAVRSDGIRQAIRDSGIFTEAKLAQAARRGEAPPQADTKLNLVRLLHALQTVLKDLPGAPAATKSLPRTHGQIPPPLRNQPPAAQPRIPPSIVALPEEDGAVVRLLQELIAQTEGALARIQVSQLSSLGSQESPAQVWVAEVPLRFGQQTDLIQFRIEHHRGGGAAEEYWSVTFAFELEELGAVRARVVFFRQELSATLWAERESTAKRFQDRLQELRERIERRGLKVKAVDCHSGIAAGEAAPGLDNHLISEKA